MKMVAASKLRRAQEKAEAVSTLCSMNGAMIARLQRIFKWAKAQHCWSEQALIKASSLVISADRGLCGGFNGGLHSQNKNMRS